MLVTKPGSATVPRVLGSAHILSRFYGVGGIGIQLNWFITGLIGSAVRMVGLHGFGWLVRLVK